MSYLFTTVSAFILDMSINQASYLYLFYSTEAVFEKRVKLEYLIYLVAGHFFSQKFLYIAFLESLLLVALWFAQLAIASHAIRLTTLMAACLSLQVCKFIFLTSFSFIPALVEVLVMCFLYSLNHLSGRFDIRNFS